MNPGIRRLFWSAVWLAVWLVAIKATYLGRPAAASPSGLVDYLQSLAAISFGDVAFAVVAWVAGRVVFRQHPRWFEAFCALSAAYAAMNVAAFAAIGGPLTYPLLFVLWSSRMLRAAVWSHLGVSAVATLVAAAIAYVVAVELSVRPTAAIAGGRRAIGALAVVLAATWLIVGYQVFARRWVTKSDWRISENAHWRLVSSTARKLGGERMVRLPANINTGDLEDFSAGRPSPTPPPAGRSPNIILIVLESVGARWTSLGNSGYRDPTPTLAAEAAHALVADRFYAHIGRSSNSLAAMLLSSWPTLDFRDITAEFPRLPGASLASVLRDRGYRTAFLTSSDLAWADWATFLQGRGFDDIRDYRSMMCSELLSEWGVEDRCLIDALLQRAVSSDGQPFFLMAWTAQTHYPYEPSPGVPQLDFVREPGPDHWDQNRYLNVLHETDRQLGRFFDALRGAGRDEDTLVAIVGDHGQAFGFPHPSYGQGQTAYEEDVRVPMMLWFPQRFPEGARAPGIGGHVDLAPTIAALAGVPVPAAWQGRSLLAAERPPRTYFYVAEDRFILGIREDNWKYLLDLRDGLDELYDLARDPDEQHNLALDEPERCARLRLRLAAWMEANRRQFFNPVP